MKRPHSLVASFTDAVVGIAAALRRERNMRIHFMILTLVVVASFLWRLSSHEWLFIVVGGAFVIVAELFNSALECAVDLIEPNHDPLAALAKQMAAGAVLVSAITAALIGLIVFGPRLWDVLLQ